MYSAVCSLHCKPANNTHLSRTQLTSRALNSPLTHSPLAHSPLVYTSGINISHALPFLLLPYPTSSPTIALRWHASLPLSANMAASRPEDFGVSQNHWVEFTGMQADAFVALCLQEILPDLQVWLEFTRVALSLNAKNVSPNRQTVLRTLEDEYGLVSRPSADFVASEQCTPRTIAAHSVVIVHSHLTKIAKFTKNFSTVEDQYDKCYTFLRFVTTNRRPNRCLAVAKRSKAEEARSGFVEGTSVWAA